MVRVVSGVIEAEVDAVHAAAGASLFGPAGGAFSWAVVGCDRVLLGIVVNRIDGDSRDWASPGSGCVLTLGPEDSRYNRGSVLS